MSELKQMATAEGSHTLTAKVSRIEEKQGGSGPFFIVYLEGYAGDIFSKTKPSFEAGYEGQITVDAKPSRNDASKLSFFLGRPKTGGGGGFAGGGGKSYQPKTKEEIHSSCLAGIIKSGLDREKSADEIRPYLALYMEFMELLK